MMSCMKSFTEKNHLNLKYFENQTINPRMARVAFSA